MIRNLITNQTPENTMVSHCRMLFMFKLTGKLPAFFLLVLIGCTGKAKYQLPFELNRRIIISKKCDRIILSSNRDNFFRPAVIEAPFSETSRVNYNIPIDTPLNFFVQSLSCDCHLLSMVYEDYNTHGFKIALYNFNTKKITYIDKESGMDFGNSSFSPKDSILAYLSQSRLKLDSFTKGGSLVEAPPGIFFRNFTWSNRGHYIFLEDFNSNIWKYDVYKKEFKSIWQAPNYFYGTRSITPDMSDEEKFYFLSDYQSDFNQIYRYDSFNKATLVVNSNSDKYLFPHAIENEIIYFKSNDSGFFNLKKYSARKTDVILDKAVVSDFYHVSDSINIFLLSDINRPTSIFLQKYNKLGDLLDVGSIHNSPAPRIFYGPSGIHNLIYKPDFKERGWVVWLHGGPYEQMSVRYNNYLTALIDAGYGIVVLNYPGSTGAGNKYEMQEILSDNLLDKQVKYIKHEIDSLANTIPSLNKFSLVGVSYGSIVANLYAKKYPKQVTKIVDFSGLSDTKYTTAIPILFIYGTNDFSLKNPARIKFIEDNLKNKESQKLALENEGHVIHQRTNLEKISKTIPDFLDR